MSASSIFKHMAMMAPLMGIPMAAEAVEAGEGTLGDIGLQTCYSLAMMAFGMATGLPVIFDAAANAINGSFAATTYATGMMHDMDMGMDAATNSAETIDHSAHAGHDMTQMKM